MYMLDFSSRLFWEPAAALKPGVCFQMYIKVETGVQFQCGMRKPVSKRRAKRKLKYVYRVDAGFHSDYCLETGVQYSLDAGFGLHQILVTSVQYFMNTSFPNFSNLVTSFDESLDFSFRKRSIRKLVSEKYCTPLLKKL